MGCKLQESTLNIPQSVVFFFVRFIKSEHINNCQLNVKPSIVTECTRRGVNCAYNHSMCSKSTALLFSLINELFSVQMFCDGNGNCESVFKFFFCRFHFIAPFVALLFKPFFVFFSSYPLFLVKYIFGDIISGSFLAISVTLRQRRGQRWIEARSIS